VPEPTDGEPIEPQGGPITEGWTVGESGPETVTKVGGNVTIIPHATVSASSGGSVTFTPTETVTTPPPSKKIGIVGFTQSRKQAPYGNPEWELWGLNNLWNQPDIDTSKFAAWFDLHDESTVLSMPYHVEWLAKGADGLNVYMFIPRTEWPTTLPFPAQACLDAFPHYFTNSVSWMVGLAILELQTRCADHGWDLADCEIGVWGIDMAEGGEAGEYAWQRPSVEFFLGVTFGLGINLTIADTSDLLKTFHQYGLESSPLMAKIDEMIADHDERIAYWQQQHTAKMGERDQKNAEIRYVEGQIEGHTGARNALVRIKGTWAPLGNHGNSTHEDAPAA